MVTEGKTLRRRVLWREWKTRWEMSTTGPRPEHDDGEELVWWWFTRLIRNTKSRRKLIPEVRCIIKNDRFVILRLEWNGGWWLDENDQCRWSSKPKRLYCDVIVQVTWRRLDELMSGGNDLIFCVPIPWASAEIWEYDQDWRTWE